MSAPVVLGFARYETTEPVELFVDSFLANRERSELHLLVERSRLEMWRRLESPVVRLLPVRTMWPLETNTRLQYAFRRLLDVTRLLDAVPLLDRLLLARGRRPLAPLFEQPHVARLWHQLRLLRGALAGAPWVFLSDVRDVVFQQPFEAVFAEAVAEAPLHVYEELVGLGDPRDLAGLPQVHELAPLFATRAPVLCVGTVLGTPAAAAELLERMLRALSIRPARYPRTLDQGVLNLLYYEHELDALGAVAHPAGAGGVLTAGFAAGAEVTPDGIRWRGALPPVVHQYDRLDGAAQLLAARFSRRAAGRAPARSERARR